MTRLTHPQQLSGMDAAFLHMETERVHMHTIKVLVFKRGRAPGLRRFESTRRLWLDPLPMLTQRVVELPLRLGQPVMETDPEFDLERHIFFEHLRLPGTQRELDSLVSRITSEPLPRDKPLWEATVVDGMRGGRWALVLKIHHTLADGGATVAAFTRVLTREGIDRALPGSNPASTPTSSPQLETREHVDAPDPAHRFSPFDLLILSLWSAVRSVALLPRLIAQTLRGRRAIQQRREAGALPPARVYDTPHLSFNRAVSAERVFATHAMSLPRIKALKRAAGVTLNDVVIALTSGALRRYLRRRGELPRKALVASVPITLAAQGQPALRGNRVSSIFAAVHSHIDDARLRLQRSSVYMEAAKAELAMRNIDAQRWMQMLPAGIFSALMSVIAKLRLGDRFKPPINLVISNVRGPQTTLRAGRSEVEAIYSVGPLLGSVGLNVTVWSYNSQMFFGLLADPKLTPDLQALAGDFEPALEELEAAFATEVEEAISLAG